MMNGEDLARLSEIESEIWELQIELVMNQEQFGNPENSELRNEASILPVCSRQGVRAPKFISKDINSVVIKRETN